MPCAKRNAKRYMLCSVFCVAVADWPAAGLRCRSLEEDEVEERMFRTCVVL